MAIKKYGSYLALKKLNLRHKILLIFLKTNIILVVEIKIYSI